jgi:hypothetical protein
MRALPSRFSSAMISMFVSAAAQQTGCPEYVNPCVNQASGSGAEIAS